MTTALRHIACAAALLAATAANATTYNFSYTFGAGSVLTGSFDGTAPGNLITVLSNISVFRDGVEFGSGNLYNFGWTDSYTMASGAAVASLDGLENNFLFSTSPWQMGGGFYSGQTFGMYPASAYYDPAKAYVQGGSGWSLADNANFSVTRWSVTAVPEPASYAMLLGGLCLMGAIARRRAV